MIQYGDADAVRLRRHRGDAHRVRASRASTPCRRCRRPGISRPFDARRDGFVMGEGAGVLVLEEPRPRGRAAPTILGEIAGYGSTTDAHHLTAPDPSGGPAVARDRAGARATPARAAPRSTTSTPTAPRPSSTTRPRPRRSSARSASEATRIPISSTKSSIGHLLGAAGAVEAVATVRTLHHRRDRSDARL